MKAPRFSVVKRDIVTGFSHGISRFVGIQSGQLCNGKVKSAVWRM
jgi:hypothetical protein